MLKTEFNKTKDQILKLICPDCEIETRHLVLQSVDLAGQHKYDETFWIGWDAKYQIVQCQGCLSISYRTESSNSEDYDSMSGAPFISESLYPKRNKDSLKVKEFLNAPRNLRRIYREIIDSFNNEIYTLCAAGLRSIIEGICSEEGIKDGPVEVPEKGGGIKTVRKRNLQGKISGLLERGALSRTNADILHEHRFLGNEAVHELAQPSQEELKLAIQIVEHTLETIFEIPPKAKELKDRKSKRKETITKRFSRRKKARG